MKTRGKVIPKYLSKYLDAIEDIFFLGRLGRFWARFIHVADIKPDERIIDIGSGSGKMATMISESLSEKGEIVGLEPSQELIQSCRERKTKNNIKFVEGVMEDIPYTNNSFDLVLSSLAIHHVPKDVKIRALAEFKRVLRSGGRLLIMDHGKPYRWIFKVLLYPLRWNILEHQAENFRGEIPDMIKATFDNVEEKDRFYGWIRIWEAVKK